MLLLDGLPGSTGILARVAVRREFPAVDNLDRARRRILMVHRPPRQPRSTIPENPIIPVPFAALVTKVSDKRG
jgi:hypothetical protein